MTQASWLVHCVSESQLLECHREGMLRASCLSWVVHGEHEIRCWICWVCGLIQQSASYGDNVTALCIKSNINYTSQWKNNSIYLPVLFILIAEFVLPSCRIWLRGGDQNQQSNILRQNVLPDALYILGVQQVHLHPLCQPTHHNCTPYSLANWLVGHKGMPWTSPYTFIWHSLSFVHEQSLSYHSDC